ncbi:MAG: MiaB/RimO family radical SAM methylthiotransferase [Prolixibacteraceae bacterium]|jgi:tRNA-2-methylthio-N6-dimethylallyladenosine synthase|nr:MiaB/RimO family radical SAM methylthiotransferase [Prolixibacteraceae bacterium]
MKYHLMTLGCQMNKSDSERVQSVVEKMGFRYTDNEEEANLVGILACSVRQKAIDKVYSKIHKWNKQKNKRNLITFVSGCILPTDQEKFLKLFDMVFTMNELPEFPQMLSQYGIVTPYRIENDFEPEESLPFPKTELPTINLNTITFNPAQTKSKAGQTLILKKPEVNMKGFWDVKPSYQSAFEAFVPIQNGCDKFCTFCAVPYTRGREVSRPSVEIIAEVKELINKGFKTITLLGQNVNSYGLDKKGEEISFPELLQEIGKIGDASLNPFWVYFTSPHPRDMTVDVIEVIAKYKCLANQIHIPLQSGDDKVLIRMNRKHSLSDYRKIIHTIRRITPEATIFTDIIVGFTSENDDQFQNTVKALDEFKFNMAYIARYSPRPGAASSRWIDDVDHETKKERLQILSETLKVHSLAYNKKLLNRELTVLVVKKDRKEGHLSALTEGKIIVRIKSSNEELIGQFLKVKINSISGFSTEGVVIS